MVAGGYTLSVCVCTCGVQRNQEDAGDASKHKKRLGRERGQEQRTAQQLKRRRRVGLGTWKGPIDGDRFLLFEGTRRPKTHPKT